MNKPPVSGTTKTAHDCAHVKAQDSTIMVLALHRGEDGQIIITPVDVAHDDDDLSLMSDDELKARRILDQTFLANKKAMTEALAVLYEIYDHRLYRNQFRSFENFCFAIYGTHRVNDVLMKKVRKRISELEADIKEDKK